MAYLDLVCTTAETPAYKWANEFKNIKGIGLSNFNSFLNI
jgi:hypothetical protein